MVVFLTVALVLLFIVIAINNSYVVEESDENKENLSRLAKEVMKEKYLHESLMLNRIFDRSPIVLTQNYLRDNEIYFIDGKKDFPNYLVMSPNVEAVFRKEFLSVEDQNPCAKIEIPNQFQNIFAYTSLTGGIDLDLDYLGSYTTEDQVE